MHQTSIWQICSFVKLSILQPLEMNLRIRSSSPDNSENSEPLSVVIVLKTSSQCSSYWDLTSRSASMTPFGSQPGMRIIQYSRVFRSIIVSSASSLPLFAPMTRFTSQCPNSVRSSMLAGRSSMLLPRTRLFSRTHVALGERCSFSGRSVKRFRADNLLSGERSILQSAVGTDIQRASVFKEVLFYIRDESA